MGILTLRLFGKFELRDAGDRPIALPSRNAQALLAYLGLRPGQFHAREQLIALIWPDAREQKAFHSLRQALFLSRRALSPADPLSAGRGGDSLALDPGAVDLDTVEFERLIGEGVPGALERAVALYQADLLEGFPHVSAPFEEWLCTERQRLRELATDALAKLLAHQVSAWENEPAIRTALKLLALDPLQETVHRTLMRLYTRQGRSAAALRQYQVCVVTVRRELGVEPEVETRALYREIVARASHGPSAGVRGVRRPLRRGEAIEAPLVGRDFEARELRLELAAAWSGDARTIFIVGEAGIGKSRLAEGLAEETLAQGGHALLARAWESEQLPFQLWVDAIRDGGVLPDRELIESLGPTVRAELARLFPEIGHPASPRPGSRQGVIHLFEAVRGLLDRLGERRPFVLVLDDVHWADEMSLRLLVFLARRLRGVLLVVTARAEQVDEAAGLAVHVAQLEREGRGRSLRLSGLSRDDTEALVREIARPGTTAAWLRTAGDRIWTISEGNPFVIVECMRTLPHSVDPDDVTLPPGIRDLIAANLDRLSEQARQLAAVAAVIGREFAFDVARCAAGLGAEAAAEAAEELVRRRVLDAADERFHISHDRIRQVLHERLLAPRRRLLHERIAEALETVHADRLDEFADQLAHHYARAGVAERAIPWLGVLVRTALQRYAFDEADRRLDQALGLMDEVPPAVRDRLYLPLVVRRQAYLLSLRGRSREVLDLLEPLRARVEAAADPHLAGWYFFRLAYAHNYLGSPDDSRATAARALDEARRCGDVELMACIHCALAMSHYCVGEPQRGADHARQAITLLGAAPSVWLGFAHAFLAGNLYLLGELHSALALAETAVTIGTQLGDRAVMIEAGLCAGRIRVACGDWMRAREDCRVAPESQSDLSQAGGTALMGYACLDQGNAKEALPLLRDSVAQLNRLGLRFIAGRFMPVLAEAHLGTGDLAEARERARESCELNRRIQSRWGLGLGQRALGRVIWADGALPDARRQLGEAHATFAGIPMPYEMARIDQLLGELASASGQSAEARVRFREARSVLERLRLPTRLAELATAARTLGLSLED